MHIADWYTSYCGLARLGAVYTAHSYRDCFDGVMTCGGTDVLWRGPAMCCMLHQVVNVLTFNDFVILVDWLIGIQHSARC